MKDIALLLTGAIWGAFFATSLIVRPRKDTVGEQMVKAARQIAFRRKFLSDDITSTFTATLTVDGEDFDISMQKRMAA